MKNFWIFILIASWLIGACSEGEGDVIDTTDPIEEPDSEPQDSTLEEIAWEPGMAYRPYPSMPEEEKGVEVIILVQDDDQHARDILSILYNESWGSNPPEQDRENIEQVFFPTHPDIKIYVTERVTDANPNPEKIPCDILNLSSSTYYMTSAKQGVEAYANTNFFPHYPLVITSAGNYTTTFEQEMWDSCQIWGGIHWNDHVLPHMGWKEPYTEEQLAWGFPGDVKAAYAVQNVGNHGHDKDWIVVGCDDGTVLKERFVCTYYSFDMERGKIDGTSFSTPYVAKIAAEIKRRAPHYTNDEIAQLIFSTCDDLGEPGCDDVYGWGRVNPPKIWAELTKRGL